MAYPRYPRKRRRGPIHLIVVPRVLRGVALLILIVSLSVYLTRREESPEVLPEVDPVAIVGGKLKTRQTLSGLLRQRGVPPELSSLILEKLRELQDLRRCHPGDSVYLEISPEGELNYFEYVVDPTRIYVVKKGNEGIENYEKKVKVDTILAHVEGVVESSLYETVLSVDELPELAYDFADIFAWVLDFNTELRKGDRFRALFTKNFVDQEFVGYGRILAGVYEGWSGDFHAFYFEDPGGHRDYYDLEGRSLRRMFLKAPLGYRRISSYFSHKRLHPILKIYRPHYGVDYAAPVGTPVSAVGDGLIIFCGRKGDFGKLIRIKHPNSFMTEYGHLSRFARGMRRGIRVKQGQVIGYVGSTGLSTGPHLQYGVKRYGRYVNPLKVNPPAADPVKKKYLPQFEERRDEFLSLLREPEHLLRMDGGSPKP